jgi:hypothetical protein
VTTTKNVYDSSDASGHKAEPADPLLTIMRTPYRRPRAYLPEKWQPIVRVLLPFAIGFFLTNVFQTINALISGQLIADFALGAADLGLLTSVYFLTFAAAQIPIGILLATVRGGSKAHCCWPRPVVPRFLPRHGDSPSVHTI